MATADPLRMGMSNPEERLKSAEHRTAQLERRKEMVRRGAWIALFLFLSVIVALGAAAVRETKGAAQSAETAADAAEQSAKNSKAVTDFVADCTTPGGKCFKAQKQQDRAETAASNQIIYLANACATLPSVVNAATVSQKTVEIRRCVAEELLAEDGPTGPQD